MKTGIVDTGIFQLSPHQSGRYLFLRRDGQCPHFDLSSSEGARFRLNSIRVYETRSLLHEYSGSLALTSDTTTGKAGFEADNLLTNLENRTSGSTSNGIHTAK